MEEAELLEAIAAAPDDDAPRLVYADWLMQRGDPRGELVALQCALAAADALDEPLGHESQVLEREAALLAHHRDAWTAPLRALAPDVGLAVRRGLVEHAVEHAPALGALRALVDAAPLLRSLALLGTYALPWAELPLERLEALELLEPEYLTVQEVAPLPRLRRLQLTNTMLDPLVLGWLLELPARLDHLGVVLSPYVPRLDDHGELVRRLAARAQHARSLLLGGIALQDPSPLAGLPLEQLALHDSGVPPPALLALVARLPRLHTLELYDPRDQLAGLELDALLAAAPGLRRLAIRGAATVSSAGAIALARSPHARSLRRLDLSHNQLDAAAAAALAESESLRQLVRLDLRGNPIAPEHRERAERTFARTRYEAPVADQDPAVLEELARDRKIAAIKTYRERTGAGLASAKCAVERIIDELALPGHVPHGAVARWVRC